MPIADDLDRTRRRRTLAMLLAAGSGLALVAVGAPSAWAVPGGTYAFVANNGSSSVSVINTATNATAATIPVGPGPTGVALTPDGTRAYVGSQGSNTVSVINTATNAVTATIPVPTGPRQVVLTADASRLYVADQEADVVSVIDTATNTVTAVIPVGNGPIGLALTPDATRAYVANHWASTVSVIDTATTTVIATIPVGAAPQDLAITPDGTRVFVADGSGSIISTATNTVVADTGVGATFGVAFSPDGTRAYLTNDVANTLAVVDTATAALLANIPVGSFPLRVALTSDGSRAYVTNLASSTVSVIDTASQTVLATLAVGSRPYGVAVGSVPASADTTPPVVTVPPNQSAQATSVNGAVVTYPAPTATDDVDGLLTPTCNHSSGDTFPLGTTTVTCTATDAAGNVGSASFTVTVTYGWSGFLQPINVDGSSIFKLGSTVPVKFALTGTSAGISNAVATLSYAKISNGIDGSAVEATSTAAATSGNLFRYDATSGQYIFNWSTKGLTQGTYRLSVDLGDGVARTVTISLK